MQIVYLSNRPDVLANTVIEVHRYMGFIDNACVLVPRSLDREFQTINFPWPTKILFDDELISKELIGLSHQTLNYALRSELVRHDCIESEYILSDDDSRPLKKINQEFYQQDGKYNSYYFYDLSAWTHGSNSYDTGQRNTYSVLRYHGFPHRSYASHMPQIFNKEIANQAREFFTSYSKEYSLCEWSSYFNYAHHNHPELFFTEQPYKTLCWPDAVTAWPKYVEPTNYAFENYCPNLYHKGGVFYEIANRYSNNIDINFRKELLWNQYESSVLRGDDSDSSSIVKQFFYKLIKPLRRVKDVMFLEDRKRDLNIWRKIDNKRINETEKRNRKKK